MTLLKELELKSSEDFIEFLKCDANYKKIADLLKTFLIEYVKKSKFKPINCELTMFNFPGEDYSEPMVKLIYPDVSQFDNLKIKDDFEEKFKLYLVNISQDVKEFKEFRKIQQKFRIIVRRE